MVLNSLSLSLSLSLLCKDSKIICTENNNIKYNKIIIKCSLMQLTDLLICFILKW